MKKIFLFLFVAGIAIACTPAASSREEVASAIRKTMADQQQAWNNGDIETFMQGYWKSDSILFIGSAMTKGWDATLARYRKSYPDKAAMGILKFTILKIDRIADDSYLVTGRYHLTRANDQPQGIFTLLMQKKDGKWVAVYDHTS